jgi:hypothetical protein
MLSADVLFLKYQNQSNFLEFSFSMWTMLRIIRKDMHTFTYRAQLLEPGEVLNSIQGVLWKLVFLIFQLPLTW